MVLVPFGAGSRVGIIDVDKAELIAVGIRLRPLAFRHEHGSIDELPAVKIVILDFDHQAVRSEGIKIEVGGGRFAIRIFRGQDGRIIAVRHELAGEAGRLRAAGAGDDQSVCGRERRPVQGD